MFGTLDARSWVVVSLLWLAASCGSPLAIVGSRVEFLAIWKSVAQELSRELLWFKINWP